MVWCRQSSKASLKGVFQHNSGRWVPHVLSGRSHARSILYASLLDYLESHLFAQLRPSAPAFASVRDDSAGIHTIFPEIDDACTDCHLDRILRVQAPTKDSHTKDELSLAEA